MISGDIDLDKLIDDIDQQVDILTAIAADNLILNEQLRILQASKDALMAQSHEIERLNDLVDPDMEMELTTIIDFKQ